jgi:nitric oxide reductase subunit B
MPKNWHVPLLLVLVVGVTGVMVMGIETYREAPPIPDFVTASGQVVLSHDQVLEGQALFQRYALMDYGTFFGDGANRGTDYTADALHQRALALTAFQEAHPPAGFEAATPALRRAAFEQLAREEIKHNTYDPSTNRVVLSAADASALRAVVAHYREAFAARGVEAFSPAGYVRDADVASLSGFFFWGAWVCGVERPGHGYSYTHNWPYEPLAGNVPTGGVLGCSRIGLLALSLPLGGTLYLYGRFEKKGFGSERPDALLNDDQVARFSPTPTQRGTFKYFVAAALIFCFQVFAGVLTVHDFVGLTHFFGFDVATLLPLPVVRGWHILLSLLWISICWIGGSIFILPHLAKQEPPRQRTLVDVLFWLLVVVAVGGTAGIFLGPKGFLAEYWHALGNQGWEFVELGRVWQALLFLALILWAVIVARGVWPALQGKPAWSLPYWLLYTVVAVVGLFLSSFVSTPHTNFVIADFWRWMVVHMWAEAFFEVFTTVVVAYFLHLMGLVTMRSAVRVIYFGTLLYLGSGLVGISHNFYWNAKPVLTLALGAVFSTLQVVPLLLLTLEAWRNRRLPHEALRQGGDPRRGFAQSAAFGFLLAVNFWNFMGAGVFGLIINLPIVNYYEHGTYLTVNHGHAALFGVYGNLSLAAILFCARYLVKAEHWSDAVAKVSLFSLNVGLALMCLLDLLPVGLVQLSAVLDHGLWFARSQAFVEGATFQSFTWMRMVGGALFVLGGVLPLTWLLLTRWRSLKPAGGADGRIDLPRPGSVDVGLELPEAVALGSRSEA